MNRNVMIVLGGGFLIAVLVALLVQASLGSKKKQEPVKEEPRVQIVVAAADLPVGTELTEANIKYQEWPATGIFPGAIKREGDKKALDMVSGRLLRPLAAGEPVVKSALVKDTEGNFIAASL